ncbi:hypothetical protein C8F01DRAFT_1092983 [Mycena amicta]|nr:hypothetical protein C8F01DRAFT_1092983 [Mycena amicta]
MSKSDDGLTSLLQNLQLQDDNLRKRPPPPRSRSRDTPKLSPDELRRLLARPPPPPPPASPSTIPVAAPTSPSSSRSTKTGTTTTTLTTTTLSSSTPPSTPPRAAHWPTKAVYEYASPQTSGRTSHWPKAASVQHTPGGSAIALRKNKKKRQKYVAYAVIRGHQTGVWTNWAQVEPLIADFRFALQFGCKSVAEAQALVNFAQAKHWTSSSTEFSRRPMSLELVPTPCSSASDLEGRPPRQEHDPWYICYVGIHPGVYSSYLECALNTLGVRGNVHDHRNTFEAAAEEFMWAQLDGHVVVRDL